MSLRANASRTYLNYMWWILEPLLFVGMFYLVFELFLLRGKPGFFYFLIVGYVPYMWVSKGLSQASGSVASNKGLISQTSLSMLLFPYIAFLESFYKQLVVFFVLIAFLFVVGVTNFSSAWWWLPVVVAVNLLFVVVISLPFAWACAVVPDVKMVVGMVTMFLMFTSGVFFDVREIANPEIQVFVFSYQPLAFILDSYRQILLLGVAPNVMHLGILAGTFVAMIAFLHFVFHVTQHYLAEKVLNS